MASHRREVRAGNIIFAEDDPPTTAYLIERGEVEVSTVRRGMLVVLGRLGPGQLLGELAVIDDSPRTMTARALTDCTLTPIGRNQFAERLSAADPVVRALLLSQLDHYRAELASLTGKAPPIPESQVAEDREAIERIRLENDLAAALEKHALEIHLQPIEDIASGVVAGYEALVRWSDPVRGDVSPEDFIRLAEETSLIVPIGEYVLEGTCDALATLARRGMRPLPFITLNVSARQLDDPGLVERIESRLRERRLPCDALKIEITERLVTDEARTSAFIRRCHVAGIHVSLDDFGAGYSNLTTLLRFEFDQVKLDRVFVQALGTRRGQVMSKGIIDMSRALECALIAEGVETREQRATLHRLGCRYAQGWLVGKPMPLDRL
ncbi:MAG: EAL domain-containing protein [Lysobacterales bacterium]